MDYCVRCGAPVSEDIRATKVDPNQVLDLFERARLRGFSEQAVEYLRGCIQLTHAKSYRAGLAAAQLDATERSRVIEQIASGHRAVSRE